MSDKSIETLCSKMQASSKQFPPLFRCSHSPNNAYFSISVFTKIATNLTIQLANLELSVRVRAMLLMSMCHTLGHALKKTFSWMLILW